LIFTSIDLMNRQWTCSIFQGLWSKLFTRLRWLSKQTFLYADWDLRSWSWAITFSRGNVNRENSWICCALDRPGTIFIFYWEPAYWLFWPPHPPWKKSSPMIYTASTLKKTSIHLLPVDTFPIYAWLFESWWAMWKFPSPPRQRLQYRQRREWPEVSSEVYMHSIQLQ